MTDGKDFFAGKKDTSIQELEKGLGTASMVTRWREANPDLANTDKDCVKVAMDEVRKALGVDGHSSTTLRVGSSTVILLFKRK